MLTETVHAVSQICKISDAHKNAAVNAGQRIGLVDLLDHPDANVVFTVLQVLSLTDSKLRTSEKTLRCVVLPKYRRLLKSGRPEVGVAMCRN